MKELVFTFGDDGTVEVDTTRTGLSVKEKQKIIDELTGKLGGTVSEEKHKPTTVKPGIRLTEKG